AIAFEQEPRLRHVETAVGFEAPGVEADRHIIGEKVGAGEIEVNQARDFTLAEKSIVREKIGVDHAGREIARPVRFYQRKLRLQFVGEPGLDFVRPATAGSIKAAPPGDREIVRPRHPERGASAMQFRERRTDGGTMEGLDAAW